MKNRPHAFNAGSMYGYMEKLSVDFDVPILNGITLKLPPEKGSGFIKNIFFEDGFCIRYYHFSLKNSMPFYWFFDREEDETPYKLMFNYSSSPVPVDKQSELINPQCLTDNSIVLYTIDPVAPQIIPANTLVTRVALIFTKKWLEENFLDASFKITEIVKLLGKKNMPSYISEIMDQSYFRLVNEIAKEMDKDIFPVIHIKTKSLILLNDFLNKVVETSETVEQKSLYYDTVVRVEQRLKQFLLTTMPRIAQLSSEFNMSPSTLQRHFKIVYGKNIYHYYLEQKLAIGKEMIASRKRSISEVAYMLGYHKINSFSKVFKKHFGILPRDIHSIKKGR